MPKLPQVSRRAALILGATFGLAAGTGLFTFWYGQGASYMTDDPAACANCHIMGEQFAGWIQASHRSVATCNDCHTPKPLVAKYMNKAQNGFWHSFAFTTGGFLDPIQIKSGNLKITESRCRYCHENVVDAIVPAGTEPVSCVRCHRNVGHRT